MTFRVNIKALTGLPAHLDRRRADLLTAAGYVSANTDLLSGGILTPNLGRHETIVASVVRYLTDAACLYAGGDAARVRLAISDYRHADKRAAARADAALPSWPGQVPQAPAPPAGATMLGPDLFDDTTQPVLDLIPPGDHALDMPYRPSWVDLLSPTSSLRDAIYEISRFAASVGLLAHPVDALETIAIPFIGDWAGMLRTAEVFANVAQFLVDAAAEIDRVGGYVPLVWTGHAADGCRAGLIHFTYGLHDGVAPLRYLAGVYRDVATGVHNNAQLVASILTNAGDSLLGAAIDLESLGIGAPIALAGALNDDIQTVNRLVRLADEAASLVHNGFQFTDATARRLGILTSGGAMPDMTQPSPQPQEQIIRTRAAPV